MRDLVFLDNLPTALIIIDQAGTIHYANPRACELLREPAYELRGRSIDSVIVGIDLDVDERETSASLRHRPSAEVDLLNGTTICIGYTISPPFSNDNETNRIVIFQDITEWQRLKEVNDRLLRLAAVGEVLPAILHEVKNPLAAVTTALEVALENEEATPVRDDLYAILSEVRRIRLTLEGVGYAGRDLISARHHAIDHAAREVIQILRPTAEAKGVTLCCDACTLPLLPFDSSVIRAMLFNIITNSIHACRSGDTIRVRLQFAEGQAALRIVVEDTGSGMDEEVLEHCAQLFYSTKPKGSGIGLALCHDAVAAAGGRLEVRSAPGRGTTVSMTIPLPQASRTAQ